jgi:DNA polymerase V
MAFPSPAENYHDASLDLNQFLVKNPPATFFVRNESVAILHIQIGDILIVDRSLNPTHNSIILAVINGEFYLRRLLQAEKKWQLSSDIPGDKTIDLNEQITWEIWGVVKHSIHSFQ